MDPDTCLKELLALAAEIIRQNDSGEEDQAELAVELAEHAQNLDQWLFKGGFMPARWKGQDGSRS